MVYVSAFIILFICLFILYMLSENDFILIRKDITMPVMFNNIFLSLIFAFMLGRIFYIADTFNFTLLNPILFLYLIRFKGFSFFGALLGIILSHFLFIKDRKALYRILDIVTLSFFPIIVFYLFDSPFIHLPVYASVIFVFFCFIVFILLQKFHHKYSLKDGSIFYVIVILFSILNIGYYIYNSHHNFLSQYAISQLFCVPLIFISLLLIIINETKKAGR